MANYDTSIRVNTNVDNSDLRKLQKEFDSLSAKLDKCYEKGEKLEALGVDKQSKQWKSLVYDTAQYEAKLEDVREQIQRVNSLNVNNPADGFEKIEKNSKKCFNAIHSGTKKSNGLFSTMASRLKGIALSLLIFNWITKGFNAMISAMKEGFQNLAQYSSDYNDQMSDLKSSMAETKNALAAAFEPVVNTVIPYLTQMIQWLNIAIDKIGQFFAVLKGSSTYTKASKQTINYAKSLDTASKSAKRALASFDELNVLSSQESGGKSSGEATGADAFETADIDNRIINALDYIKGLMRPFIDDIATWWNDLNFEPLIESFFRLKDACEPFVGYIYDGLRFFLDEILLPISKWVVEDGLPSFLNLLASGFDGLSTVIDVLKPGLLYIWENVLKPLGEFTGEAFLFALDLISQAVQDLSLILSDKSGEITVILQALGDLAVLIWKRSIKPTIDFIMGGASVLVKYISNVVGDIIDILAGIITFIEGGVFTGDWEKALDGLVLIFKGIVNGIIDLFEGVVNSIIGGLNNLSFDIPDWIPEIGGQKFGFDLEKLHLPRLADGDVIRGGRPFAAILGDQRPGQVNIETPLQTMIDAFKQALNDMGGGAGGNYTFVAQLDGNTIFKETIRRDQILYDTTGRGGFQH